MDSKQEPRLYKGGSFLSNFFGSKTPAAPSAVDSTSTASVLPAPAAPGASGEPPAPPDANTPEQINTDLKTNISKIAKTVIDSILTSKNLQLEQLYADFINKNGSYKIGRDLNIINLQTEVDNILKDSRDNIQIIQQQRTKLTYLKKQLETNIADIKQILDGSGNPLDLNNDEKNRFNESNKELTEKIKAIEKDIERLTPQISELKKEEKEEEIIITKVEELKKEANQMFKINFNI